MMESLLAMPLFSPAPTKAYFDVIALLVPLPMNELPPAPPSLAPPITFAYPPAIASAVEHASFE
jgi:hypothetical protein